MVPFNIARRYRESDFPLNRRNEVCILLKKRYQLKERFLCQWNDVENQQQNERLGKNDDQRESVIGCLFSRDVESHPSRTTLQFL